MDRIFDFIQRTTERASKNCYGSTLYSSKDKIIDIMLELYGNHVSYHVEKFPHLRIKYFIVQQNHI